MRRVARPLYAQVLIPTTRAPQPQVLWHMYPAGQLIAGVAAFEDWCALLSGVIKLCKTLCGWSAADRGVAVSWQFSRRGRAPHIPLHSETATEVQLCC